ncbi:hypothetical protein K0M31_016026 [Melipona bicolor]|uniref:Uncharacterized protein n=1 Tax=Melipona bicolor TaxID=60889 RepID=A0AA40KT27_9HYME|nr:hypothetical protein K0M31_016026 [Melipona bicolor]
MFEQRKLKNGKTGDRKLLEELKDEAETWLVSERWKCRAVTKLQADNVLTRNWWKEDFKGVCVESAPERWVENARRQMTDGNRKTRVHPQVQIAKIEAKARRRPSSAVVA